MLETMDIMILDGSAARLSHSLQLDRQFFMDIRIYAFPNAGRWYDLGYFLGALMFLGGGGAAGRR
jgi:hypothetical protein